MSPTGRCWRSRRSLAPPRVFLGAGGGFLGPWRRWHCLAAVVGLAGAVLPSAHCSVFGLPCVVGCAVRIAPPVPVPPPSHVIPLSRAVGAFCLSGALLCSPGGASACQNWAPRGCFSQRPLALGTQPWVARGQPARGAQHRAGRTSLIPFQSRSTCPEPVPYH